MTALLIIGLVSAFLVVVVLVYLLGFRLGGQSWMADLQRVRAEAAEAERQLHDLTRSAFVSMAEAAERRHFDRPQAGRAMSLLDTSSETREIEQARANLSIWIRDLAEETAAELGVHWRGARIAPQTLEAVVAEFRAATLTGLPARVSNRFCEQTIYLGPDDNVAFRFVHDSRHYFLRAGFETEPELLVPSCHLARLRRAGYPPRLIEYRLLEADTVGQALFVARTGHFVRNQRRFALRCLTSTFDEAITDEVAAEAVSSP